MNLFARSHDLVTWFTRVIGAFLRVRRNTTLAVVASSVTARITQLLAFILPLKIILIAASPGVPGYFRSFVTVESKIDWIAGLSVAAVMLYALTLALDALTKKLSLAAGLEVLQGANQLAIVSNHREEAKNVFAGFTGNAAKFLFAAAGLIAVFVFNWTLFLSMAVLLAIMFVVSAWVLGNNGAAPKTPAASFIRNNSANYLKILSSITFLFGFLVILHPFLAGKPANALIAVGLIILLRQIVNALSEAVNDTIRLSRRRQLIDTMVFPDHQWRQAETQEHKALRDTFDKARRQDILADVLKDLPGIRGALDVRWSDIGGRGVSIFEIVGQQVDGTSLRLQLLVFPRNHAHAMENEDFLFGHIAREKLHAPPLVAQFALDPFACRIYDAGTGQTVSAARWRHVFFRLNGKLAICQPPDPLVKAFCASHPLLDQRLNEELIGRMEVAVDDAAERRVLGTLQETLPLIQSTLAHVPVQIVNPDLSEATVLVAGRDRHYIMNWGRWRLDPVGANLSPRAGEERLTALYDLMRQHRTDLPADFSADHIAFARRCSELESAVSVGRLKAALGIAEKICASPILKTERGLAVASVPKHAARH